MKTVAAEIRYAMPRDAEALSAVHEEAWRNAYSGLIPHRALGRMIARRGPDWWRRAIESHAAILVLDYEGSAVGYATIGRNRTAALGAGGEIYELYFLPRFQGLGYGRRLFEAARRLLASRQLSGLVIWALEDNGGAVEFYRRMGGEEAATGSESFDGTSLSKLAFRWD